MLLFVLLVDLVAWAIAGAAGGVMGLVALAPRQLVVVAAALLVTLLLGEVILRFLRRSSKLQTLAIAT